LEIDLYPPKERHLEKLGLEVKGEVCGCDLVALSEGSPELVAIGEMKQSFTLELVFRHELGPRLNNRAENSHQPFRRRERAMQRFRSIRTLQKFGSVHTQVHNHFNQERHLVTRRVYKQRRTAALAEWRALAA
jgi:DDE superfamily endonuclease